MKRIFAIVICASGLIGCGPNHGQIVAEANDDDAKCKALGAKPGTDIYIQCRLSQQQQRTQMKAALMSAPADTCTRFGNSISCY